MNFGLIGTTEDEVNELEERIKVLEDHHGKLNCRKSSSEKATKFCEIFPLLLSSVVPVKSKGKISQNFVAFSEYMNFE